MLVWEDCKRYIVGLNDKAIANDTNEVINNLYLKDCIDDYTMTLVKAKEVAQGLGGTVYEITFTPVNE